MTLENRGGNEKTRADIIAETERARTVLSDSPDNEEARYTYANLLYQGGDFWKAWEIAKLFSARFNPSVKQLTLAARLAFLRGDYGTAERLYRDLVTVTKSDQSANVAALVDLMFTYYVQDKFDAIKELEFPTDVQLPQREAIMAFEGQPYELEWIRDDKISILPFLMTDPVPLLMAEVNGVPIPLFFDTGGDTLIIDPDIAKALSIESTASAIAPFGGGLEAKVSYGQVSSLKLADVTMKNVPIMILPIKRLSGVYENKGIVLGGAIGTAMLRHFLATVDYEHGRLVLRARDASSLESLHESQQEKETVEIPFVLDYTHLMLARGRLNDQDGLTAFVDSGLAQDAKLTAPIQTLEFLGIPAPELNHIDPVGGGGGVWKSGFFDVASIGLGPLVQRKAKGEFGALPPEFYWSRGYIQDFLISHSFLRQYSTWTIDFDRMIYIFER